jgi:thioredoxin reductase (NADPH)
MTSKLTLYSREYCHLCHDMLAALEALRGEFAFTVEVLDVDLDPALEARYDELVPVLEADGHELCHYFLDEDKVRAYLAAAAQTAPPA